MGILAVCQSGLNWTWGDRRSNSFSYDRGCWWKRCLEAIIKTCLEMKKALDSSGCSGSSEIAELIIITFADWLDCTRNPEPRSTILDVPRGFDVTCRLWDYRTVMAHWHAWNIFQPCNIRMCHTYVSVRVCLVLNRGENWEFYRLHAIMRTSFNYPKRAQF